MQELLKLFGLMLDLAAIVEVFVVESFLFALLSIYCSY